MSPIWYKSMKLTTLILIILMFFLLLVRLFFDSIDRHIYRAGEKVKITHSFLKEPKKNSYGQYFFTGNLLVSVPLYPKFLYGETIIIEGIVSELKNEKGRLLAIENPKITRVESKSPLFLITSFIRKRVEGAVLTTLPSRESGLFLGIVLGVRDRINNAFYEELRDAGVLHIIAASGQNVSILASILLAAFQRSVKRRYALLFTGLCLFLYSAIVGFDPPIVRATIMATISFGALTFGRQNTALFALFITGWGMVMYQPENLTGISFQLSFLSTLGIIMIKPLIERVFTIRFLGLVKDDLTTTLAAQIATFPLMIASFGAYSLLTLPVNLLILWTIPFLMILGVGSTILAIVVPLLAKPLILLSYPFLAYFAVVIDLSEKYKWVVEFDSIPGAFICGYYLIVIGIVFSLKNSERRRI